MFHPTGRLICCALLFSSVLLDSARAADGQYDLVGQLAVSDKINYTDVWGWTQASTARHFALVGNNASGLHIVDVTDPTNPFEVSRTTAVPRYEMKTWKNLVYTVDGMGGPGGILNIANPASPAVVGTFPGGHTLWIDDEGFLYVSLPGLKVYDLNPDPRNPAFVWEVPGGDGHDCVVVDDVLYEFRGYAGTFLWDVSDRYHPELLGSITDPAIEYHHHGWPSKTRTHLFILDEFAFHPSPDITVWNITNPASPVKVGAIFDPTSSAHNGYVIGDFLYVAYYTAGLRIYNVSNPASPVLVDSYDTSAYSGEGNFDGAWGVYPFAPGGRVYVSDRPNGLFVFAPHTPTGIGDAPRAQTAILHAAHPNPFSASATIRYELGESRAIAVDVFDASGRRVRSLETGTRATGEHRVTWNGKDDAGREVASGVYFVRLRTGTSVRVQKAVLVR